MIAHIIVCKNPYGIDEPVYDEHSRLYIFSDITIANEIKNNFVNELSYAIAGSPTKNFFGKEIKQQVSQKDLEKWEHARKNMRVMTVNIEKLLSANEE